MKTIAVMLELTVEDETDPAAVAEGIFNTAADDPDNVLGEHETVDSFDYKVLE